ncbi:MAG: NosD domain-containing protein [Ignavibacteriaceae bacterium]
MKMLTKCSLLFFVLFYSTMNYGQAHYFNKYDGIPIIAHTNLTSTELVSKTSSLEKMKEIGIYGFYAVDLNPVRYSIITNSYGLKVFPYQYRWEQDVEPQPYLTRYTNAVYSVWLAGGKGNGELGDVQIDYNPNLANLTHDGRGIETKSNAEAGHLFDGPYYYQSKEYKAYGGEISYTADFRMKIELIGTPPSNYKNDLVCTLQVVASRFVETFPSEPIIQHDTVVHQRLVYVSDFENSQTGNVLWNTWMKMSTGQYFLTALNQEKQGYFGESLQTGSLFSTEYMQYKVYWTGLPYLKLSIDTINIYDFNGRNLFNTQLVRDQIIATVNYYKDTNYVLGWHGIVEPASIDNYLCFRKVNEIIHEEINPNLDVFTSIAGASTSRYTWRGIYKGVNHISIYPGYEFIKRSGLNYISINLYNYHYPFIPPPPFPPVTGFLSDPLYKEKNIKYVADSNLVKIVDANIPISYSSQSGRFYKWDNNLINSMAYSINPSFAQMNYHINLGLLFGAKELTLDPVFTLWDEEASQYYREGLIDYTSEGTPLTSLGEQFRDVIKPRLSGLMGQTMKTLNQAHQILGVDVLTNNLNNINYRKLKYINCPTTGATICTTDVGFFDSNEPWKNHFFIVNRHYSSESSLTIGLKDLYVYSNWTLSNLTDTAFTPINKDSGNEATFNEDIPPGDGKLYSLAPTVIYGGELTSDETIGTTTTLSGNLIVGPGITLTVNSVYNLYGDITIKSGGAIKTTGEGVINVYQGKRIIAEGISEISGTSTGKITFNFIAPVQSNGIYALQEAFLTVNYVKTMNAVYGIIYQNPSAQRLNGSLTITNCEFINCNTGIKPENLTTFTPLIAGNIFTDCNIGIMGINNSGTTIMNNSITSWSGIWLTNTSGGSIINNQLEPQTANNGVGIYLQSSLGTIRENYIDNFSNGIFLANSSPLLGENIITNNSQYGIYCGSGSSPQLSMSLLASEGNEQYFLIAGLNYLENNGIETNNTPELYISNSFPNLDLGYNCIIDDRDLKSLLIGGEFEEAHPPVPARMNYWGDNGNEPYERFGINVDYGDYLTMCAQQGVIFGVNYIEMRDNNNVVTDTLYSLQQEPVIISAREILESEAENAFITGDYSEAKNKYLELVNAYGTEAGGIKSYHRLYETDKIVGITDEIISSRITLCQEKANQTTDTLLRKMVNQIISLYYIERREFQTALSRYEGVIGTSIIEEEALFAELDAYTVAYLSSQSQGGLGKVTENKYLIKSNEDYTEKIQDVLSKKFSVFKSETKKEVIPEHYNLFQNYPNPFNPETVISYQLVAGGQVSLKVYDILGNEIVTLVDREQESGRYQVTFDASKLASGVYICRIIAGDFVKTIKMSLVK